MMPYDPRLKDAMDEIMAVLEKHDICGSINIVSKTHSENGYYFPSWSAAQITDEDEGILLKCKQADYPSKEAQNEAFGLTLHTLLSKLVSSSNNKRRHQPLAEEAMGESKEQE